MKKEKVIFLCLSISMVCLLMSGFFVKGYWVETGTTLATTGVQVLIVSVIVNMWPDGENK